MTGPTRTPVTRRRCAIRHSEQDQDMPPYVTRAACCAARQTAVLIFPTGDPPTGAATTPAARPPARRGRDATRCWRARANSTRTPRSPVAYYVPHPPPYTRSWWCLPRGRRVAEVPEAGVHQRSSEVISGHSESGHGLHVGRAAHAMKVAIQGCAASSGGISAHQGSSGESSAAPTWTSRGWWGASNSTSSLMPPARATES